MKKLAIYVCFLLYLSVLSYLLFFSNYRASVQGMIDYNLIPFKSIIRDLSSYQKFSIHMLTDNFFGNIFAFVPLGILAPLIFSSIHSVGMILFVSFGVSFTIEILQFLFTVGAFDVDDMLLNAVGGCIGYVIMSITFLRKLE